MWALDHREGWVLKNWCFWTVVLKKTLERPLDCKEINSVNPKGNKPWIFIGRTDAEAPIPDAKKTHWEKILMLGKIEGRRRRDERGWDGWVASLTQWTWVWANSRREWRSGKPGVGSWSVGHYLATWTISTEESLGNANYSQLQVSTLMVILICNFLKDVISFF